MFSASLRRRAALPTFVVGKVCLLLESDASAVCLEIVPGDKSEKTNGPDVYAGKTPRRISYLKTVPNFSKTDNGDNGLFIGLPVQLPKNVGLPLKPLPC
jgi:hypothetical protein